jgi:hypothetical protein
VIAQGAGAISLDGVSRGERQRRQHALSGVAGRPGSPAASTATQASQAGPMSAVAPRRGTQARGPVVSPTDLGMVG